jgi:hypothetical protein
MNRWFAFVLALGFVGLALFASDLVIDFWRGSDHMRGPGPLATAGTALVGAAIFLFLGTVIVTLWQDRG